MKRIRFIPGDTNYRWDFSENSPFLKRSQTVLSKDIKLKAKSLSVKKRYYELVFSNEKEAYLSRNQNVIIPEINRTETKYVEQHNLVGNPVQINFSMNKLLERLIDMFTKDPQCLFTEAKRINVICQEEGLLIPRIEAFNKIDNWDEFMQLLKSLCASKSPFKFELMVAAVTRYAELCGG
ncbi:hypothetical protein KJ966_14075 [bacterium]|nr:hypothetical protein [bacterium]